MTTQITLLHILQHINTLDTQDTEAIREYLDELVHDCKETEGMKTAPSNDDDEASDDEHLDTFSKQASALNNEGFESQLAYLMAQGYLPTIALHLHLTPQDDVIVPPEEEFSDAWATALFEGANFGEPVNRSANRQRALLAKTLRNQMDGFWSGHTIYHICLRGGLLKDARSGSKKALTEKGLRFMSFMVARLPAGMEIE